MIIFINDSKSQPFIKLKEKYTHATYAKQTSVEAISIASFNYLTEEVNSRYVNLKIVDNNEFIFFTNYNSPKSIEFKSHDQIAASIYWVSINTQIRIKAKIKKTSTEYNQKYFCGRSSEKNALAISSKQSKPIDSYKSIEKNYKKSLKSDNLKECPNYWGGYSFVPYYFEFWEGHKSRLNKREVYEKRDDSWKHLIIQP
jgi:pyridoxamine 5'-phosphate oxidase